MSMRTRRQELRRAARQTHTVQHFQLPQPQPIVSESTPPADPSNKTGKDQRTPHASGRPLRSMPVTSPNLGLPTPAQYLSAEEDYLSSLNSRKREKALISQAMFDDIWDVLHDPTNSKISTPQFRWWVRKMFVLAYSPDDTPANTKRDHGSSEETLKPVILHENRPVAVKNHLYNILCYCHQLANHGGRDRTTAIVRKHYSWIPKELVAKFVKACPTCQFKKSSSSSSRLLNAPQGTPQCLEQFSFDAVQQDGEESLSVANDESNSIWSPLRSTPTPWLPSPHLTSTALFYDDNTSSQPKPSHDLDLTFPPQDLTYPISNARNDSSPSPPTWPSSLGPTPPSLLAPIRRVESENDADFPNASRIRLPPLMKALSDGTLGSFTPIMRPPSTPQHLEFLHSPVAAMDGDDAPDIELDQSLHVKDSIPIDPILLFKEEYGSPGCSDSLLDPVCAPTDTFGSPVKSSPRWTPGA